MYSFDHFQDVNDIKIAQKMHVKSLLPYKPTFALPTMKSFKFILLFAIACQLFSCPGYVLADVGDFEGESEEMPPILISTDSPFDFSILGPETVQLPVDTVELKVVFNPNQTNAADGNWTYYWTALEGAGNGYADAYDRQVLELTKLKPGKLTFQVSVSNGNVTGRKEKQIIVAEAEHANQKPVAVIKPAGPVFMVEKEQLVLDADGSKDDDGKIVTYEWKLKKGPSFQLPTNLNTPILTLINLPPGNYTFSLKVIDEKAEFDETEVNVHVSEERDDPPQAKISRCGDNASGSISIRLPLEKLYLCGNGSTDDKNVTEYRWVRKDSGMAVDSTGSSQSILTLSNLHPNEDIGPYVFELEVSDIKGQKDSAVINVFVAKADNQAPRVNAGVDSTIILPETSVVLDGTVEDDGTISSYKWTQIQGPSDAVLLNADSVKATATELKEGEYIFEFIAVDDGGLNSTSRIRIKVQRTKNDPPVARASNVSVYLPESIIALNGSLSSDDAGIVEYKWIPQDSVPACISALDGSDTKPVLLLSGLVEGEFYFNLTVYDQQKLSNSTSVKLTVLNGNKQLNAVELYLNQMIENITYRLRRKLQHRLESALASQTPEATAVYAYFTEFGQDPKTGNLRVVFYAEYTNETPEANRDERSLEKVSDLPVLEAQRAVNALQKETAMIDDFSIIQIDALYCQRSCSNHGRCNNFTKECECETYWMGSIITKFSTGKQLDCSWSKLYFWIMLTSMLSLVLIAAACSTAFKRRSRRSWICQSLLPCWSSAKEHLKRKKYKRRKRYEPLSQDGTVVQMSSSSLHSDSDVNLFESKNLRERLRD